MPGNTPPGETNGPESEPIWTRQNLLVLGAALVAMGTLSILLGQDADWDLKNYHVYNAYAFLGGRFERDIAPAQMQTYHNPAVDVATYVVMQHATPRALGFLLGSVQGLSFSLLYLLARSVLVGFGRAVGIGLSLLCAGLGVSGAVALCELGTMFHDLTTSALVLGGVLVLVRAVVIRDGGRRSLRGVALGGLLIGLGAGLKYTVAVYVLAAVVATFVTATGVRERFARAAVLATASMCGFAVSAGYWLAELGHRFGNPLFPYYNSFFRSPYAEPLSFADTRAVPQTLGQALAYPFSCATLGGAWSEIPFRDLRFATLYVLAFLVLALAIAGRALGRSLIVPAAARSPAALWICVFFGVAYFVWLRQWGNYRYVGPLEALAPLSVLLLGSKLVGDRRRLAMVAVPGFTALAVTTKPADYGRVPWNDTFTGVRAPPLPVPANTTIVMTSMEPFAYVIPSFPEAVRFVRIESNLFDPHHKTRLTEEVAAALARTDREYHLLTVSEAAEHSRPLLAVYSLAIVGGACKPLPSKLDSNLVLCPLRKMRPGSAAIDTGDAIASGVARAPAGTSGALSTPANPLPVCTKTGYGTATVSWRAAGTDAIEIHVGAPNGILFARGGNDGASTTGNWVGEGTTMYLQDVARYAPLTPEHTLARLVFHAVPGGPCP
jgi:hypothetical protein